MRPIQSEFVYLIPLDSQLSGDIATETLMEFLGFLPLQGLLDLLVYARSDHFPVLLYSVSVVSTAQGKITTTLPELMYKLDSCWQCFSDPKQDGLFHSPEQALVITFFTLFLILFYSSFLTSGGGLTGLVARGDPGSRKGAFHTRVFFCFG